MYYHFLKVFQVEWEPWNIPKVNFRTFTLFFKVGRGNISVSTGHATVCIHNTLISGLFLWRGMGFHTQPKKSVFEKKLPFEKNKENNHDLNPPLESGTICVNVGFSQLYIQVRHA